MKHSTIANGQRAGWSASQRREWMNAQRKARNAQSKAKRRAEAEQRNAEYQSLSHDEKVRRAMDAPGNSRRQLSRLGVDGY